MSKSKKGYSKNTPNDKSFTLEETKFYPKKVISNYFWKFVDLVACKNRIIAEKYERIIGEEYKKEYKTFKIFKYNKALHIGCGAYPLTEITLSNLPGKEIVGIDKNPKAVESAKNIIRRKMLDKKIKIKHGNGINYSLKGFDIIIISSCSTPKQKILENIFKNANKNCIIIVREINSTINIIMDYINRQNLVTYVKKVQFSTLFIIPFFWNAIYLIKKENIDKDHI